MLGAAGVKTKKFLVLEVNDAIIVCNNTFVIGNTYEHNEFMKMK